MNPDQFDSWLSVDRGGLFCRPGGFHVDPSGGVPRAVITHGHSDHARPGHEHVLATRETLAIMQARLGTAASRGSQAVAYGEPLTIGEVTVRLVPAGHVLGSAQVVIEWRGRRVVVSGDYKRAPDPTCPPYELVPCDLFITEATFALPVFQHGDASEEVAKLLRSREAFPERTHVVGVYGLGKCQRLIASLREAGYERPIFLHGALIECCALYESFGVALGALEFATAAKREALKGEIVLAPPSALADRWSRRLPDPLTGFASGWMRVRARARQHGVELPLVISDHADWNELVTTIEETGAEEVWVTHGREDALIYHIHSTGRRGRALSLIGREDEDQVKAFAELLERLAYTPSRNDKLRLLARYFAAAPDPDRGYALAALTDGLFFRLPLRRILTEMIEERIDPVLFDLSRDYVGDTAETIALLWPEGKAGAEPPRLSDVVRALQDAAPDDVPGLLAGLLDALPATGRFALLKLMTGALRVGVSARLAKTALAAWSGVPLADIEEVWHGVAPPYEPLFAWLAGTALRPEVGSAPIFRPLMLSHQIEDRELLLIEPAAFAAEWKWDGIRVQASSMSGEKRLFSRTGDDISGAFPDVLAGLPHGVVLDGELLVMRGGDVAPFNDLQQRLNRKNVTPAMQKSHPAHIRLYDMLYEGEDDLRPLPFAQRRARLEAWHEKAKPPRTDVSALLDFASVAELEKLWAGARETGIEGLMLKRRDSPYIAGRPKGHWYKWKRAPLTLDAVLLYAQRGSGKRSSYYSDYTFGAWREAADGTRELVPVGKSYFGFTDAELKELDAFVRNHTVDSFGPVRQVEPKLVFEVAFDSVHRSTRHKSGVAMRFPRIHRIRWDKPAEEADTLETLTAMIVE